MLREDKGSQLYFVCISKLSCSRNAKLPAFVFNVKSAFFQDDIYMYGGKIDATGNVTSQLWVFHIPTQTWAQVTPQAKEQYAVVGHSAHIITGPGDSAVMLVIFGHCPLYGYISNVQEYNLSEWGPVADGVSLVS